MMPYWLTKQLNKVVKYTLVCLWQSEGIASEYSTSAFISLSSGETYSGTLNISFPSDGDLVPGSQYIQVTAIGTF